MNRTEQHRLWLEEQRIAHIHGWDFFHIQDRCLEPQPLPWDYRQVIDRYRTPDKKLLDIDTGGGEFLLSLEHPFENTAATENYPPNVALCRDTLLPLGIDFRPGDGGGRLPFADGSFDLILDRHGDYEARDLFRLLRPGGIFITQQVGAENDREFTSLLCGDTPLPFPGQYLETALEKFQAAGFQILEQDTCFRPILFTDVGALVWFARVIPWEFPGFSVETHLHRLENAQQLLESTGAIRGTTHRFLLVAQKPYK